MKLKNTVSSDCRDLSLQQQLIIPPPQVHNEGPSTRSSILIATCLILSCTRFAPLKVHPEDPRYQHFIGREVEVPMSGGRRIKVGGVGFKRHKTAHHREERLQQNTEVGGEDLETPVRGGIEVGLKYKE